MTLLLDRPSQQALLELKRVLIVDDEEPIRRLLGYMLQSHGYEVVLAADAREARLRLDETPFAWRRLRRLPSSPIGSGS